jgi:hypothetical protein
MMKMIWGRSRRESIIGVFALIALTMVPMEAALAQWQEIGTPTEPLTESQLRNRHNRMGFTLILTMGLGLQKPNSYTDWGKGLGGLNFGVGGFVSNDTAVMFRVSGTSVKHSRGEVVSGVAGPGVQHWINDSLNVEGVLGMGFVDYGNFYNNNRSMGLMLGVGYSFYHGKTSSLQFGIEYGYVFSTSSANNLILAFGWQLL